MSQLVKRQKREDDGSKASLMTHRVAAECLLLSIGVAAEGRGILVYQYIHWLISSWQEFIL